MRINGEWRVCMGPRRDGPKARSLPGDWTGLRGPVGVACTLTGLRFHCGRMLRRDKVCGHYCPAFVSSFVFLLTRLIWIKFLTFPYQKSFGCVPADFFQSPSFQTKCNTLLHQPLFFLSVEGLQGSIPSTAFPVFTDALRVIDLCLEFHFHLGADGFQINISS